MLHFQLLTSLCASTASVYAHARDIALSALVAAAVGSVVDERERWDCVASLCEMLSRGNHWVKIEAAPWRYTRVVPILKMFTSLMANAAFGKSFSSSETELCSVNVTLHFVSIGVHLAVVAFESTVWVIRSAGAQLMCKSQCLS